MEEPIEDQTWLGNFCRQNWEIGKFWRLYRLSPERKLGLGNFSLDRKVFVEYVFYFLSHQIFPYRSLLILLISTKSAWPYSWSAAWLFVIILIFIFKLTLEMNTEENSLTAKNNHFLNEFLISQNQNMIFIKIVITNFHRTFVCLKSYSSKENKVHNQYMI